MATRIRYRIIGTTTLVAVLLYLDRVCIGEIGKLEAFKSDLGIDEGHKGLIFGSFFFAYALLQVPAGWLSDRFGARKMLPAYILLWSLCVVLTGLANGLIMFIAARLVFGAAQAGCYPTSGSLIKRWAPLKTRGTASSFVSVGGRMGGVIAPILTAWLLAEYFGWRTVLMLYGILGALIAGLFWFVVRERPAEHPDCDEAEQALIEADQTEPERTGPPPFPPLMPLIRSGAMWLMCTVQFTINVGWVFIITYLPTYLQDNKNVPEKVGGVMSSLILAAGVVGMLCGGRLTDFAIRRFGLDWGRKLPLIACYLLAATAWIACLRIESAWPFVAAMALVAFATDLSVPAIWAYMQDVGGRSTAAVFGWGNMWGNLGAFTILMTVPWIRETWDPDGNWHEVFLVFAAGYLIAMLASFGINATRKIESS